MRRFIRKWWPFSLLCCTALVRLALAEAVPAVMPTAASLALASCVCSVCCGLFLLTAKRVRPPHRAANTWTAFAGVLLFGGQHVALLLHASEVVPSDVLLVGCLVPVVIAIASAALGSESLSPRTLWPGVAASAAMLLLLPEPRIHSLASVSTLVLIPAATGTGAVLLRRHVDESSGWWPVFALLGACALFAGAGAVSGSRIWSAPWQACAFDIAILGATLLTIKRTLPEQYGAFFVLVPFAVLIYGLLLLRPTVNLRITSGLAVLLASGATLLRTPDRKSEEVPFRLLE